MRTKVADISFFRSRAQGFSAAARQVFGRGFGVGFWIAAGWLLLIAFCAVFADWLPVLDPLEPMIANRLNGPLTTNILGADGLGRDMLSRLVHGARVSVVIALTAVTIGMIIGGTLGILAGYFRGHFERGLMAVLDVILAFPWLVLLLALVAFIGQSLFAISVAIGFLWIPAYARVARANTLSVVQREYVLAARAMGASTLRILLREVLPNVILPVLAYGLVAMGLVIIVESALAFLGLSVEAPQPTWGGMISEGKRHLATAVHVALVPSVTMFLTVLSLNYVGDRLRSRFDVRESNL
ncbi:ABC transporter permease [Pseudohongiella acticola]|jgi:peptide/nickel transport system permease protein|uniref:ABC transporter permease n=1 Tax=Pseudohongiella acticola TaxID=1524254 RepID=A0A1E8CIS0_9GAMM|nr:ABC transporter permease [Pseudohongiella acticola]OFE12361.1 ABC transporter permease [Pseudohongiella acticola]